MEKEKRQHPGEGHLFGTVNKAVRRGSFPSHRHPMAELYICLGGSATDTIDRRERHVGTGDIFVHTAEGVHTQRDLPTPAEAVSCGKELNRLPALATLLHD